MTVIVLIALMDYLWNSNKDLKILPGAVIAVCGWYFRGDIANYTGLDLSLTDKNTDDNTTDDMEASAKNPNP